MYDFLRKNPAINLVKKNIIMQTQYKSWPCLHVDMVKDTILKNCIRCP